jgi:hypothetical protein
MKSKDASIIASIVPERFPYGGSIFRAAALPVRGHWCPDPGSRGLRNRAPASIISC